MAATACHPRNLVFASDATLAWYSPDDTVQYGFCNRCGSSLFWRAHAIADKICITAGTLDQPTGLRTTRAWWVAEAGDYHDRSPGLEEFDYES
jgi:hypothetical protein